MPGNNVQVTVNVYPRGSLDYFLNDRYRFQPYLADAANNTLHNLGWLGRNTSQNITYVAQSQVHLAHKTLKSR